MGQIQGTCLLCKSPGEINKHEEHIERRWSNFTVRRKNENKQIRRKDQMHRLRPSVLEESVEKTITEWSKIPLYHTDSQIKNQDSIPLAYRGKTVTKNNICSFQKCSQMTEFCQMLWARQGLALQESRCLS